MQDILEDVLDTLEETATPRLTGDYVAPAPEMLKNTANAPSATDSSQIALTAPPEIMDIDDDELDKMDIDIDIDSM